jgi:hypothetical protein
MACTGTTLIPVSGRHCYVSRFGFSGKQRPLRLHCVALSGLRLYCVTVWLEITVSRTVRFKTGLCSVARFNTALSYFQF